MSGDKPLVSFIVPTYNGEETITDALESIKSQTYANIETIVIDDNSDDNTRSVVKSEFPNARLISLPTNKGHSTASNIGIENSCGDYLALMDDDVEILEDWTTRLLAKFKELDEDVAMIHPKILEEDNHRNKTEEGFTQGFQGCGVLCKRHCLEDVGYYDENYFLYVNDMELGARLVNRGYRIYAYPQVRTFHKASWDTSEELNPTQTFYSTRNFLWYYWRHFDRYNSLFATALHLERWFQRANRDDNVWSFVKGILAALPKFKEYYIDKHEERISLSYEKRTIRGIIRERIDNILNN